MKVLDFEEAKKLYREKFGKEPEPSEMNWRRSFIEEICDALDSGKPIPKTAPDLDYY